MPEPRSDISAFYDAFLRERMVSYRIDGNARINAAIELVPPYVKPPAQVHVCPCGVAPERFSSTRRIPGRVLAVGRLTTKKAPEVTIRAFAEAQRAAPNARLDMVGDGPLMADCAALVDTLGLADAVTLHGAQTHDRVRELMGDASVFVQHSVTAPNGDTEGLPVAILEAMASALPVVSTRHSGIPEAVVDGDTGVLVDEHDGAGMAKALSALLADPGRAEQMGRRGRERVLAQFTQDRSARILREVMAVPEPAAEGAAA